jgi:DNA-directed RNA polymerase subunit K
MGAPVLIETNKKDPLEIAMEEFERGVIPITVKRRANKFVWLERYDIF